MRRDAFQAIADPTRRQIIGLLHERPLSLNAVAAEFPVSRPAISRHIRILTQCGLVVIAKNGRERICSINAAPLQAVADWTNSYRSFWTGKLDALAGYLDRERPGRKVSVKRAKNKR